MLAPYLLHHLVTDNPRIVGSATALCERDATITYDTLGERITRLAAGFVALDLAPGDRLAVLLDKRIDTVVTYFACSAAGLVLVPINPLLKPDQVGHIVRDAGASAFVTQPARLAALADELAQCPTLRHLVCVGPDQGTTPPAGLPSRHALQDLLIWSPAQRPASTDQELAAILYTSGSTGRPKGVMLSHRNLMVGAQSVASYLEQRADDCLLAALPFSFDAGFSQLTTAFFAGAQVALLNYLMPRDVLKAIERHRVTGLTAVPPLWTQLAQLDWHGLDVSSLRYIATTGGRMPQSTLGVLRRNLPAARTFLMYGLTEAFRATYLPPALVDSHPDSMGRAIPNCAIHVVREDGSECDVDEPGELVQRGPLVAQGYWNDPERTQTRFRPFGTRNHGAHTTEIAVFSGDTVRRDADGLLYFVGRRDEMIKTSGYRVSPTEVEAVFALTDRVVECCAFGIDDEALGQRIVLIAVIRDDDATDSDAQIEDALIAHGRRHLPAYMVPARIVCQRSALARNPNGKIDRLQARSAYAGTPSS